MAACVELSGSWTWMLHAPHYSALASVSRPFTLRENFFRPTLQILIMPDLFHPHCLQVSKSDKAKAFLISFFVILFKVIRNTTISENSSNIVNGTGKPKALSSQALCSTDAKNQTHENFPRFLDRWRALRFRPVRRTSQSEANPENNTGTRLRAASKSFGHGRMETCRQRMKF